MGTVPVPGQGLGDGFFQRRGTSVELLGEFIAIDNIGCLKLVHHFFHLAQIRHKQPKDCKHPSPGNPCFYGFSQRLFDKSDKLPCRNGCIVGNVPGLAKPLLGGAQFNQRPPKILDVRVAVGLVYIAEEIHGFSLQCPRQKPSPQQPIRSPGDQKNQTPAR